MLARPSRETACTKTPVLREDTKDTPDSQKQEQPDPAASSSTTLCGLVPGVTQAAGELKVNSGNFKQTNQKSRCGSVGREEVSKGKRTLKGLKQG